MKIYKKGDRVIPTKGPHKRQPHEVIAVKPGGLYNIKPILKPGQTNKYRLGAAAASQSDLTPVSENIREFSKDDLSKIEKIKSWLAKNIANKNILSAANEFLALAVLDPYNSYKDIVTRLRDIIHKPIPSSVTENKMNLNERKTSISLKKKKPNKKESKSLKISSIVKEVNDIPNKWIPFNDLQEYILLQAHHAKVISIQTAKRVNAEMDKILDDYSVKGIPNKDVQTKFQAILDKYKVGLKLVDINSKDEAEGGDFEFKVKKSNPKLDKYISNTYYKNQKYTGD